MKKWVLFSIIAAIFTCFILSCTKEEITVPEESIYGSWVRLVTDSQGVQFNAELKIKTDNRFDFILLEDAPGHTNSSGEFTLNGDIFTVINDADCGVDGAYEFIVSSKKLALIAVADECAPRVLVLQSVWDKK